MNTFNEKSFIFYLFISIYFMSLMHTGLFILFTNLCNNIMQIYVYSKCIYIYEYLFLINAE